MNAIIMKTLCLCMGVAAIGNVSGQDMSIKPITNKDLYSAAWNGKRLVVVGEGGFIATSSNDTNWQISGANSPVLRSVVWAQSMFIAVGLGGTIVTSRDGNTWKKSASVGTVLYSTDLYSVVGDEKNIIAAGDDGTIVSLHVSGDTISSARKASTGAHFRINAMAWNDKIFVAAGEKGNILTSTNLTSWRSTTVNEVTRDFYSVAWNGSKFVIVGENSMSYCASLESSNGTDWTRTCTSNGGSPIYSITWTGNSFITTSGRSIVIINSDGNSQRTYSGNEIYSIIKRGNELIAVGSSGCILSSPDSGVTWKPLGRRTVPVADTPVACQKSGYSIDINDRWLKIAPSPLWRGDDISVEICTITGRKAVSSVYRTDPERIEIPLRSFPGGTYVCTITAHGEKAVFPFTLLQKDGTYRAPGR